MARDGRSRLQPSMQTVAGSLAASRRRSPRRAPVAAGATSAGAELDGVDRPRWRGAPRLAVGDCSRLPSDPRCAAAEVVDREQRCRRGRPARLRRARSGRSRRRRAASATAASAASLERSGRLTSAPAVREPRRAGQRPRPRREVAPSRPRSRRRRSPVESAPLRRPPAPRGVQVARRLPALGASALVAASRLPRRSSRRGLLLLRRSGRARTGGVAPDVAVERPAPRRC